MTERNAPLPRLAVFAALALSFAFLAFAAFRLTPRPPPTFHGTTFMDEAPAPDFTLVDHDGRPTSLAQFRGQPVLVFFGFTRCPDICPLTLARLTRAIDRIGRPARDVRVLLVTVDPERDTPEVLREYTAAFGPQVIGLTGTPQALEAARAGYGVYVQVQPADEGPHAGHASHGGTDGGADVVHSTAIYGIDRRGDLQVVISSTASDAELASDVRTLARM